MGSVGADRSSSQQRPFTVLVTGFAPFKRDYPVNPSWEIARALPEWLPPIRAKTATASSSSPAAAHPADDDASSSSSSSTGPAPSPSPAAAPVLLPPVRILVHPEPIWVSYGVVRDLVPKLWDGDDDDDDQRGVAIDAAIHVGMAGPRLFYSIERRGHRDGYVMRDVDGELLRDDERRAREGAGWVWAGCPAELETELQVDEVIARWRGHSPKHTDLRVSEDAGHYLCDFIYFSSLAHLYKAGERRRVLFLHVPCDASEHSIALGRELLLQLIRSVAESEVARRGSVTALEEAR